MSKKVVNIIVLERSDIIYEGLFSILTNTGKQFNIQPAGSLAELEQLNLKTSLDVVFINPILVQNQIRDFQLVKRDLYNVQWIGLVYSFVDQQILSLFDQIISINDSPNKIITSLFRLLSSDLHSGSKPQQQETLSEREKDVLKLLVTGKANKEIADKLNISTHTVISHRKNISQKTGIKSVSGLTIYAVVNNIITIDSYIE